MSVAPTSLVALRQMLAARFPSASRTPGRTLATGVGAIDEATGGLPQGAVTELVCSAPSCGGHLLLGRLLGVTRAARLRVALVESADQFDPASHPADDLVHLVWARATDVSGALAAADLLARDANLGLVVLDLSAAAEAELRRVPATTWYRFQRAVEPADLALLVLTPRALVGSAQLRLELNHSHEFSALEESRLDNVLHLAPQLQRQRAAVGEARAV